VSKNKYNAIRYGGFDSQLEKAYAERLDLYVKAGEIQSFIHHPVSVRLTPSIRWNVAFLVPDNEGNEFHIETKGVKTEGHSLKLRMWKDLRPDRPLLVVAGKKVRGEYNFFVTDSIAMGNIEFIGKHK